MISKTLCACAALICVGTIGIVAAPAVAQDNSKPTRLPSNLNKPAINPSDLPSMIARSKLPKGQQQQRIVGCMVDEVFNTQSISRYSVGFTVKAQDGRSEFFNFSPSKVERTPDAIPISSAEETNRWARIQDALERATAADRPVMVDYTTPDNKVFGIRILWGQKTCVEPRY